ncbi:MAG: NADH-quinone oxidoreductase subunit M [Pedosphaera sp.]|nr:NADH-quinone oxidoreductase subunit M [Pedosphaera sp.]MSU43074.1 NADH-quinone oxidoreductase subunit M [Pedosphaera sp.]
MSPLTVILGAPLLMAVVLMCVPADRRDLLRRGTLLATMISLLTALLLFLSLENAPAGPGNLSTALTALQSPVPLLNETAPPPLEAKYQFKFTQRTDWMPSLGISYHVGTDGLSAALLLMATLVAFAAACCARDVQRRDKEFYVLLLLMSGGIFGAFASLDLFGMYLFHELALVPTFIMIGVWGRGEDKNYAAYKITLYLSVGAMLVLAGLIGLAQIVRAKYPPAEFSGYNLLEFYSMLEQTHGTGFNEGLGPLIFPALLIGFGILVSLWPFHTWAPMAYASAPTATAMMHAGVIKKFGLYGLIRIVLPLHPYAPNADYWWQLLLWFGLANILWCGLVAMRQKDLNWLLGNSSVAHMGFVFLGIASLNFIGLTGAVLVMVAHGLLAALAFGLSGHLYAQTKTLEMSKLGGLRREMPFIGTALLMALLAGCGVPGFANFVGEITVLFGLWKTQPIVTAIVCWAALVIGAVYMLRAARQVLHGPPPAIRPNYTDARDWSERLPFVLLLGALLFFGLFPNWLTEKMNRSYHRIGQSTGMHTTQVSPR